MQKKKQTCHLIIIYSVSFTKKIHLFVRFMYQETVNITTEPLSSLFHICLHLVQMGSAFVDIPAVVALSVKTCEQSPVSTLLEPIYF